MPELRRGVGLALAWTVPRDMSKGASGMSRDSEIRPYDHAQRFLEMLDIRAGQPNLRLSFIEGALTTGLALTSSIQ